MFKKMDSGSVACGDKPRCRLSGVGSDPPRDSWQSQTRLLPGQSGREGESCLLFIRGHSLLVIFATCTQAAPKSLGVLVLNSTSWFPSAERRRSAAARAVPLRWVGVSS